MSGKSGEGMSRCPAALPPAGDVNQSPWSVSEVRVEIWSDIACAKFFDSPHLTDGLSRW